MSTHTNQPATPQDESFHRLQRMAWGLWGKPPLFERRRLAPLAESYAAGYHEARRAASGSVANRPAYAAGADAGAAAARSNRRPAGPGRAVR